MKPVLAYRFFIRILNGEKDTNMKAQSVSGLSVTMKLAEIESLGGDKEVPASVDFPNLIIKRAVLDGGASAGNQTLNLLSDLKVDRSDLGIHLLNPAGEYIRTWSVIGAYAIKWDMSEFDASSNDVIMETLEFKYEYLREI